MSEFKKYRNLIWELSKNDFKKRYAGSSLGRVWAFVQPIVTVVLYYFVFGVVLPGRVPYDNDVPYVVWLTAGLVPWFFFNEAVTTGANVMNEYNYLVKKVVFKVGILPFIKTVSATFIHIFFIFVLLVMYFLYRFKPCFQIIELLYYSFCLFMIALAITYITSAVTVFFKDLLQIINIFLMVGMWGTPILWHIGMVEEKMPALVPFFRFNPINYIIEGYRSALFEGTWVHERWLDTIVFWGIVAVLFAIGAYVFKKLRPLFADVL
ncbi:MAG: ABC transporter permease [Lachnospiraceae bacterium]|nr:ABC transporter permease [Lachnospiraceae bacterium]